MPDIALETSVQVGNQSNYDMAMMILHLETNDQVVIHFGPDAKPANARCVLDSIAENMIEVEPALHDRLNAFTSFTDWKDERNRTVAFRVKHGFDRSWFWNRLRGNIDSITVEKSS